jgi:23S rRNA (cytidine2498-2'-O)-methyltransferase
LIRASLLEQLKKKRRRLLRNLQSEPGPFTPATSLVQVLLNNPEEGFISVAPAPLPWHNAHLVSPYPKGEVPVAADKSAPSRAFAKLVEAELRLGKQIGRSETCVDLGAAPGSWTYMAVQRGAKVTAVDRSTLRDDLMRHRNLRFESGDAFKFKPPGPVDWLLCDVIAPPERTAGLLCDWLCNRWCRHFIVTLKLKDDSASREVLTRLKQELPALADPLFITRLSANKKEAAVFGIIAASQR